jgi:hypothetical protein
MKILFLLSVFILLFASVGTGREGDKGWINQTGNDLLPICTAGVELLDKKDLGRDRANDALNCLHYVGGFLDGYGMASVIEKGKPALCLPKNANTGQVVRILAKWLKDHPERLNESAATCMFAALVDAFVCKSP